MNLDSDLTKVEQKAYNESIQDGFIEILLGILLIFIGLTMWSRVGVAFIVFYPLFGNEVLNRLKRRYTYPRIGYVKLLPEDGVKIGVGILKYVFLVIIFLVALSLIFFRGQSVIDIIDRLIPIYIGLILTGAFIYIRGKSGNNITYLYIGVSLILGALMTAFYQRPYIESALIYLSLIGIFFIGAGAVIFFRFIKTHPIVVGENANGQ